MMWHAAIEIDDKDLVQFNYDRLHYFIKNKSHWMNLLSYILKISFKLTYKSARSNNIW